MHAQEGAKCIACNSAAEKGRAKGKISVLRKEKWIMRREKMYRYHESSAC